MKKGQIKTISYCLLNATSKEKEVLKEFKLKSILDYADGLKKEEKEKIIKYVEETMQKEIQDYKIIKIENQIIGCIYVKPYNDGVILDEIYLIESYRNKKIGSSLLKKALEENKKVFLWVYKRNLGALNLYKKFGFKIKEETDTRYFMVYESR